MDFYYQRQAADIQLRKNTNAEIVKELVDTLAPVMINLIMMIIYLIFMFRYSWILALLSLFTVAVKFVLSRVIANKRINITRVLMRDKANLASASASIKSIPHEPCV